MSKVINYKLVELQFSEFLLSTSRTFPVQALASCLGLKETAPVS